MMGTSGNSSTLTGGTDTVALSAVASLLEIISNPEAAKAALKELTAKNEEIQAKLEEAKNHRVAMESIHKDVTSKTAEIDSKGKTLAVQDTSLQKRETAVSVAENAVKADAKALSVAQKEFSDKVRAREQDHKARNEALVKNESELAGKISSAFAEADKTIAAKQAEFDNWQKSKTREINDLNTEATKRFDAATAALADATEKQKLYDERLQALQKLIQPQSIGV